MRVVCVPGGNSSKAQPTSSIRSWDRGQAQGHPRGSASRAKTNQHLCSSVMISSFRGDHAFLSNMHPAPCLYEGEEYATVEHAFQAAKVSPADRAAFRARAAARSAHRPHRHRALACRRDAELHAHRAAEQHRRGRPPAAAARGEPARVER